MNSYRHEQKPKIIIFDLDGTLTESKQTLSSDMAELVSQLLLHMPVGVMSGADSPQFKDQFLAHLPSDANLSNLFLFPTMAAECLEYKDGEWKQAYDYAFTSEEKNKIVEAMELAVEKTGISKGEQIFGKQIEDRGEQVTLSALGQQAPLSVKSPWDPDHKKRLILVSELEKMIPEFEISIGGATSIDVTKKGISKEDGIIWLENHFGIQADEMLYIGDALYPGGNDTAVNKTKIQTQQVSGPEETREIIRKFL